MGRYLGCNHLVGESTLTDADDILGRSLPGILDETKKPRKVRLFNTTCPMAQRVESYLTFSRKPAMRFTQVATPFLDESTVWSPPDGPPTGALAPIALKVLMKVLYDARVARPRV
jgi:hypothetical protein